MFKGPTPGTGMFNRFYFELVISSKGKVLQQVQDTNTLFKSGL
jgi:hypothetical protein